jgi:hypothetical protein
MTFVTFWARASVRRQWRSLAGIAILLGIVGGLALFALAGARRTQSAYPRFLRSRNPSTMAVDIGGVDTGGEDALAQIAQLPEVVQARAYIATYTAELADGEPNLDHEFEALGSVDGRYFDQDVFTPVQGRRPDPARADEVAVNEAAANAYGYHIGQKIDFGTASREDVESGSEDVQVKLETPATIVGIGVFIEEVLQDDTDRSPLVLFTPAFMARAKGLELYAWDGLVLRHGDADVAAVTKAITDAGGAGAVFRVTSTDTFHALQAVRPVSLGLATFGIIAALACLTLVAQALDRHVRAGRTDAAAARSMGASPRLIATAAAVGPAGAVVAGSVLAGVVALAASPAMPIGRLRRFEAAPGFDVDWTVIGLGVVGLAASLVVILAVISLRATPDQVFRRTRHARTRGAALARLGSLPAPAAAGLRFAFEPGDGPTVVPVRSVMAGTTIAIAALTAALCFGASMTHLIAQPRLYGWDWDATMVAGAGYGNVNPIAAADLLAADVGVDAFGGAFFGTDHINGDTLPLLGMAANSEVTPPIRSGRMIRGPGEIVLGTTSFAELGKKLGDTVTSSSGPLEIVGTATFPSLGVVHGDHTSLGVGGIVATEQLPGYDRNIPTGPGGVVPPTYGPNVLFVRFRPGADRAATTQRLGQLAPEIGDYNGVTVTRTQRPAEIVNAGEIRNSSTFLGVAVAFSALASLGIALTAAVRRRRRDLALLKAMGFTRRQLSYAVAWEATATVLVGIVLGVPIGIAAGRLLWERFADQLDVVPEPAVPAAAIAVVAMAAIVVANLLAALPAREARRVPASLVLRTE